MDDVHGRNDERSGCNVCDERFIAKKRCFPRIDASDFHHSLFDDVDATGADETQPSIHVLNDECMDLILSYFNIVENCKLGLVCKRWYNLCMSKISRTNFLSVIQLKTELFGEGFDDHDDEAMNQNDLESGQFEVIKKNSNKDFSVMSLMSVVSINCGTLTTLSLTAIDGLNAASLYILSSMMPNLTELELWDDLKLNEGLCTIMTESIVPRLEALSFYAGSVPDNVTLRKMLSGAVRLKFLSVKDAFDAKVYEDDTWEEDGLGLLEVLAPTNPLVSCEFYRYVNLRPKSLEYILRNYSDTLQYLNLSCTNLEGLTNMSIDGLPKLERMTVFLANISRRHEDIEDLPPSLHTRCSQQLIALLKLMPNLRVLDLSNHYYLRLNGMDIVEILSENCPLLEELHLTKCFIPAERLVNLTKLKFLKRLILGKIHDYVHNADPFELVPATNLVDCFKFLTDNLVAEMPKLEELSIEDTSHAFSADDIVSFIDNAGPNFKTLSLSTMYDRWDAFHSGFDSRHNFIEEAARKCMERCKDRDNVIRLLVYGLALMHRNSCNTAESREGCSCRRAIYTDIAPEFLQISNLQFDHDVQLHHFYPNLISQYGSVKAENKFFKLPRFF